MKIALHPIIDKLKAIYELDNAMERYNQYVNLMRKSDYGILPLGDFSPMGKRQKKFIDDLISLDAESYAEEIFKPTGIELDLEDDFRAIFVVSDQPKNGWTNRYLTEAENIFLENKQVTFAEESSPHTKWILIPLWTTDYTLELINPSKEWLLEHIRSAIFRRFWKIKNGIPVTLRNLIDQEGGVAQFLHVKKIVEVQTSKNIESILLPLLESTDYPLLFSAMYGDIAAKAVGYESLGLPPMAGFNYARFISNKGTPDETRTL